MIRWGLMVLAVVGMLMWYAPMPAGACDGGDSSGGHNTIAFCGGGDGGSGGDHGGHHGGHHHGR